MLLHENIFNVYIPCRQIKMSSPNMNNLIITGCMLSYTSVIVLGLDSHLTSIEAFPYICTARAWMLMWGFTPSFGSMFSKTWRVHSIFTNVQLNKKVYKPKKYNLILWQTRDEFHHYVTYFTLVLIFFITGDERYTIISRNWNFG